MPEPLSKTPSLGSLGYKTPVLRSLERTRSSVSTPKTPKRNASLNSIIPKDTPVYRNVNSTKGAYPTENAEKQYVRYADEAQRWVIGPMPISDFLSLIPLPPDAETMPDARNAFDLVPSEGSDERQMYGVLNDAINNNGRCPSVKFYDTSTRSEQPGLLSRKPDIIGYDAEDAKNFKDVRNGTAPAKLGVGELSIEVKIDDRKNKQKEDPFQDPDPTIDSRNEHCFLTYLATRSKDQEERTEKTLGQITAYAVDACARQHRTHYFSILIIGSKARFIRWDRAGAIVSEKFDYKEKPQILCEFLWRFHLADPVQRGYDPTVVKATAVEEAIFKDTIAKHVALQLDVDETQVEKISEAVERFYEKDKVTKIDVYDETTQCWQQHLVSIPVASPESLAGRATRGYWSVKISGSEGEIGFLKDTWRIDVKEMDPENIAYEDMLVNNVELISESHAFGDVRENYEETFKAREREDQVLSLASRPNTASLVSSGDCPADALPPAQPQCTLTDGLENASWVCNGNRPKFKVTKHTHYRLVLKTVGYPLTDFTGSGELFEAAADVFETLAQAYEKCSRMHRDVSLGNIILVRFKRHEPRRGVLIDWEFSTKADGSGLARDYWRSGTWAYMSVASLMDALPGHKFRHSNADDLESLLYVLIYCSVRWLEHGDEIDDLSAWIFRFFHDSYENKNRPGGGTEKFFYVTTGYFTKAFIFKASFVQEWFRTTYEFLKTNFSEPKDGPKWTIKCLRPHYKSVRGKLPRDDRPNKRDTEQVGRATYTPRQSKLSGIEGPRASGSKLMLASSSRLDGSQLEGPVATGSKRPLANDDQPPVLGNAIEDELPAIGTTLAKAVRYNKRSRFDVDEGTSRPNEGEVKQVSSRRSSKRGSKRSTVNTSAGSSRRVDGRSSSRRERGSAQSSARNSSSRHSERRSLRLKEKASASSIER